MLSFRKVFFCLVTRGWVLTRAYAYIYMVIKYSKGKDQLGKVSNPARGPLNREN